jgi:hypothetical protein
LCAAEALPRERLVERTLPVLSARIVCERHERQQVIGLVAVEGHGFREAFGAAGIEIALPAPDRRNERRRALHAAREPAKARTARTGSQPVAENCAVVEVLEDVGVRHRSRLSRASTTAGGNVTHASRRRCQLSWKSMSHSARRRRDPFRPFGSSWMSSTLHSRSA